MANFNPPSSNSIWAAIGFLVVSCFSWLARLEKRSLSRSEHFKICEQQNKQITDSLSSIKDMLLDQNHEFKGFKDTVTGALHGLDTKVAVLQTRLDYQTTSPKAEG